MMKLYKLGGIDYLLEGLIINWFVRRSHSASGQGRLSVTALVKVIQRY